MWSILLYWFMAPAWGQTVSTTINLSVGEPTYSVDDSRLLDLGVYRIEVLRGQAIIHYQSVQAPSKDPDDNSTIQINIGPFDAISGESLTVSIVACDNASYQDVTPTAPNCSTPVTTSYEVQQVGAEYPEPDINGYTSYYQRPVLFSNQTLLTGWASRMVPYPQLQSGFQPKTELVINSNELLVLDCSGVANTQGPWRVLKQPGDLVELEGNPVHMLYGICEGAYDSFGDIELGTGGTADTQAGLRKIVCISSAYELAPTQRNTDWNNRPDGDWAKPNHDPSVECILPRMRIANKSNWFMSGLSLAQVNNGLTSTNILRLEGNVNNITFDRMWVSCWGGAASGSSYDCVRIGADGSSNVNNILFQKTVISHQTPYWEADMQALGINLSSDDIYFVDSEIPQVIGRAAFKGANTKGWGIGGVIENVDMWEETPAECDQASWLATGLEGKEAGLSASRVIDVIGAQAALFGPQYDCGTGQHTLLIKHASADANKPFAVINSRIWGSRATQAKVSGDASYDGEVILLQQNPGNLLVADNFIEGTKGVGVGFTQVTDGNYGNIQFIRNRFDTPQDNGGTLTNSTRRYLSFDSRCWQTPCENEGYSYRSNSFGRIPAGEAFGAGTLANTINYPVEFSCNKVQGQELDTAGGSNTTGQDNLTIDGADLSTWTSVTNTTNQTANEAGEAPVTYWRKLLTNPEQHTTQPFQRTFASKPWSCGL